METLKARRAWSSKSQVLKDHPRATNLGNHPPERKRSTYRLKKSYTQKSKPGCLGLTALSRGRHPCSSGLMVQGTGYHYNEQICDGEVGKIEKTRAGQALQREAELEM